MKVLVTGATGFVGQVFCRLLAHAGHTVRAAVRTERPLPDTVAESVVVGDIGSQTVWDAALRPQIDAVVHLAALAHQLRASDANNYMDVNARGTGRLAQAAAAAGVRRFVLVSSIKVNGEQTTERAYTAADEPRPRDAYGISKRMAEAAVLEVAGRSGMEAIIVRPPLVYGPCVRANFLRLLQWVQRELPLPLGRVRNARSLVSVWNLCDLLARVLEHPAAAGRTWLVSDGEDLSTPDLIRRIARAMNRRARLLPVPVALLEFGGALLGRGAEIRRLVGSLRVDITDTRDQLGWSPSVDVDESIARTVEWYLSR